MKYTINMPRIDPAMEKGIIGKIFKKEGEHVKKDELLLQIVTEKVVFDYHSPYEGYISKIFHKEGEEIIVGEPIIEISDEPFVTEKEQLLETQKIEEIIATPAAKRLAREYGIDLKEIKGSGPGGRITQEDVLKYIEEKKKPSISPIMKIVAERVTKSHLEIPPVTINMDIEVSNLLKLREKEKISFDSFFIYACSRIIKQFNLFLCYKKGEDIAYNNEINIAFAFDHENELYMLVIKNADKKSLYEIEAEHSKLIEKARNKSLALEDVQGSTFAITNLGVYNVRDFTPIVFPNNSAILGIGTIHYEITNKNGKFEISPVITLSLTFDHRIINGAYAAKFLQKVKEIIEEGKFGE
jgi:pyruvate dehydrogenase E2 component (dihydrolipoamide acetyltransferase)